MSPITHDGLEVRPPSDPNDPANKQVVQEKVRALLEHVEINNIRTIAISATLNDAATGKPSATSLKVEPGYFVARGKMANRFQYAMTVTDANEQTIADISLTILVEYGVPDDYEPDREAADAVASTTGYFAAWPYARELVQSMTSRLQLDPLILGFLHRGHVSPNTMSVVRLETDS